MMSEAVYHGNRIGLARTFEIEDDPENCSSPFFFGMPSTSAKLLREQLDDNFAARPGNFQSNFATIGFGARRAEGCRV